jgi:hypothetical protein
MIISDIANDVALSLSIEPKTLIDIIDNNLTDEEKQTIIPKDKIDAIKLLINSDNMINNFENKIKTDSIKNNYKILKENLAKLQVLVLIKKLKKSSDCDEILNSFIEVLNNKVVSVNNMMQTNLTQVGGGNNKYYEKYIHYKLKYLTLSNAK